MLYLCSMAPLSYFFWILFFIVLQQPVHLEVAKSQSRKLLTTIVILVISDWAFRVCQPTLSKTARLCLTCFIVNPLELPLREWKPICSLLFYLRLYLPLAPPSSCSLKVFADRPVAVMKNLSCPCFWLVNGKRALQPLNCILQSVCPHKPIHWCHLLIRSRSHLTMFSNFLFSVFLLDTLSHRGSNHRLPHAGAAASPKPQLYG